LGVNEKDCQRYQNRDAATKKGRNPEVLLSNIRLDFNNFSSHLLIAISKLKSVEVHEILLQLETFILCKEETGPDLLSFNKQEFVNHVVSNIQVIFLHALN
jgi:hypothetical protein